MPQLSFKVQADYEKVIRLREEISKLKQEIKGVDAIQNPTAFNVLNSRLQQTSKELGNVTNKVAQASATMETDFKQKIYVASQSVNRFTEEIIKQKKIIADTKDEIRTLSEQYRSLGKYEQTVSPIKSKLKGAKDALAEQQYALFQLTQEQATARLSVKKLRDEYALFKQEGGGTVQTMDLLTSKMKGIATTIIGGMGLKELASHIISVRAEFESMETSLKVLLGGNQERLDNIMRQIKDYALASPLNTKDMVGAVQMMTSFGIEAEKSIDYLKAIGDISMGNTGKFNSLALAFSQMSSAGKLMGQDLLQMVNAGFNPLEEISRKTGKSIGELKEQMSKGAISSQMVQDAFISATSAGGKFFGMSQEGAKTLNGQISMLQESFDVMFNEIGEKGEGVVMAAVQTATKLVENYEQVGRVLLGLVETYGAYRVGLALATIAQNGHTLAMTLARAGILLTQKAQAFLNATMLANPYVMAATALGALIGVMISQKTETERVADATKRYNEEREKAIELEKRHNEEIQKLCDIAGDESLSTENRRFALVKLEQKYPSIFKRYDTEAEKLSHILDIKREIAALDGKNSVSNPNNELSNINKRLAELDKLSKTERTRTSYGAGGGYVYKSAQLTLEEQAEQKSLLKRKMEITKQISKATSDIYLTNLTGISNSDLDRQIKQRKNLLAKMSLTGKKYGKTTIGGAKGIFSREELEGQIGIFEAEKAKRNKKSITTKKDLQDQKKSLQADLDKLSEEEAKGKKGAELKKKIAALTKRENDAYSVTSGKSGATTKQIDYDKMRREQSDSERNLEISVAQSRIDAMQEGYEKEKAQRDLNHKKELEDIDKKRRDFLQQKRDEAKQIFEADPKNKGKKFNASSIALSAADNAKFDEITSNAKTKHSNEDRQAEVNRLQSLYDYLKQYGTVQEQMYAISKEYDEKIANERDANRKKILEAEKRDAIAKADAGNMALNIDWSTAFNGVGNVLKDIAKETLKEVEAYMQTTEFKALSPESKKTYADLRNNLRKEGVGDATSPFNFGIWGKISEQVKDYQNAVKILKTKTEAHTQAVESLKSAEKELSEATDEAAKSIAQSKIDAAKANVNKTGKEQVEAKSDVDDAEQNLTNSTNAAAQGINNFTSALNEMSNGSLYGFANGITKLVTGLMSGSNGVGKSLSQLKGNIGGLIGAILQILDALGDDPANFIGGLLKNVTNAIDTILDQIASGQLIETLVRGIFNLIGTVIEHMALDPINALTGGKLDFYNSNEQEVKETTKRLTTSNEALQKSINNLKESIDKSGGMRAVGKYQEAYDAQKQMNENQRQILATQMNMHGKYHSNNYYWNREIGEDDYARMNAALEKYYRNNPAAEFRHRRVTREEDVLELTPEQMQAIQTYASSTWTKMLDVGKYDKKEYWEKYVEMSGKLEELTDKINQNLTQVSFDSLRSDFVSSIMDMKKTAADFSEDFTEMMAKAWTNAAVSDLMQDDLNKFYKNWASKMKAGQLNKSDIDVLRSEYQKLTKKALNIRDIMSEATGYTGRNEQQKATINEARNLSEDTGSQLIGRLTAVQIAVESGNQKRDNANVQLSFMNAKIEDFKSIQIQARDIANETRDILNNSYMELKEINVNTGNSAAHLKDIRSDIKDLKKIMDDKL